MLGPAARLGFWSERRGKMSSVGTAGPRPGAYRALFLATLAFALCFAVWGLVSPLATRFQELYELSSTQISVVIATPVIVGSLALQDPHCRSPRASSRP